MNIGVYVSSQYGDYYDFSERLSRILKRYTSSPVLLGVYSNMKDTGYELLRRYAEEHRIRLKTYTAEWKRTDDRRFIGKRKQSLGGVIAIYHCVHNSERTIAFNSGGKGTAAFIRMSARLRRPCDVIKVDPFAKRKTPADTTQRKPTATSTAVKAEPPKTADTPKIQRNISAKPTAAQKDTTHQGMSTVAKSTAVQNVPNHQNTPQKQQPSPQQTAQPQQPQPQQQPQPAKNAAIQQTSQSQNASRPTPSPLPPQTEQQQPKPIQRQISTTDANAQNDAEEKQEAIR